MTAALEGHLAARAAAKEDEGDVRRFVREGRRILARADGMGVSDSEQDDEDGDA